MTHEQRKLSKLDLLGNNNRSTYDHENVPPWIWKGVSATAEMSGSSNLWLFHVAIHINITTHVFNSFEPEFIIVIFIHYKPRIATAILDL